MSGLASSLAISRSWNAAQLASAFDCALIWSSIEPNYTTTTTPWTNAQTTAWIQDRWNLDGRVAGGSANLVKFSQDPLPVSNQASSTSLVLDVTYPSGEKGGVQFWPLPFYGLTKAPQRAVLSYEVLFEPGFDFVLGGKLPGLYGGQSTGECTGGDRQFSCFSTRMMWRPKGSGEVYAYIPTYPNLCAQDDISCPTKYGIEISLGAFNFTSGGWTTVTQLVGMNSPPLANGWLYIYINNTLVIQHTGIVFRSDPTVNLSRILFSTFFGGSTSAWYPSRTQHGYFRNFNVWASSKPSNTTGPSVITSLHTTDTSEEQDADAPTTTISSSGVESSRAIFTRTTILLSLVYLGGILQIAFLLV